MKKELGPKKEEASKKEKEKKKATREKCSKNGERVARAKVSIRWRSGSGGVCCLVAMAGRVCVDEPIRSYTSPIDVCVYGYVRYLDTSSL